MLQLCHMSLKVCIQYNFYSLCRDIDNTIIIITLSKLHAYTIHKLISLASCTHVIILTWWYKVTYAVA